MAGQQAGGRPGATPGPGESDEGVVVWVDPGGSPAEADDKRGGRGVYWMLRNVVLGPAVRRTFRPIEHGVEHVPTGGPAILAANHLSYADWLFIPLALDRRVTFVAKSDYFTGGGLKGWAQRRFFAGTGQVPIDRSGGRASESALTAGLKILRAGDLFGIFPEGTRSHDGRLYKGRTGVARLVLEAADAGLTVPVVPTALIGTDVIAPPGRVLHKVISPTISFGAPLDFSRYQGMGSDRFVLRSITDEIMYAIMELSGQTYVDSYAQTAKEQQRQLAQAESRAHAEHAKAQAEQAKARADPGSSDDTGGTA